MIQTLITISLVVACVAYVAWQLFRTIRAGNGKAGTCCSHGCGGGESSPTSATSEAPAIRTQFISSDSLRRKPAASRD